MPLILRKEYSRSLILLWRIEEPEEQLYRHVTPEDITSAARFTSLSRRLGHLAARAALRQVVVAGVSYLPCGQPVLSGEVIPKDGFFEGGRPVYISVSHTAGLAAVMLSETPCAIDTENTCRDYSTVRQRFVNGHEESLPEAADARFTALVWSAKETMYKYSGRRELDFRRDLEIASVDYPCGKIAGELAGEPVPMRFFYCGDFVIVHTA